MSRFSYTFDTNPADESRPGDLQRATICIDGLTIDQTEVLFEEFMKMIPGIARYTDTGMGNGDD